MMNDFTKDEALIAEAILEGRKIQEYLWQGLSNLRQREYDPEEWAAVFQNG